MSAALALLIGLLVGRFGVNLVHSDARGAQPLRELASSGNPSVRDAARAGLLVMDSTAFFGNVEWVAVVDQRAHGDTIVLSLYRAQDARVRRRMVMPHPYIGGVVRYDMARHHLVTATVSIE
jgi:hypothetical protein